MPSWSSQSYTWLDLKDDVGALENSCKKAAGLYQKCANLCIKDGALARGRLTFEQGQLLDRSMAAAPAGTSWPSSLVRRAWESLVGDGDGDGGGGGGADSGPSGGDERVKDAMASGWPDEERSAGGSGPGSGSGMRRRRRRSGVGGVADAVRQMGGDPEAMARVGSPLSRGTQKRGQQITPLMWYIHREYFSG
ncbi:unnamed protein product [Ectocarpus sp. CCAP 1310/34]|nr:unnamed protein product [Ectocarpus sp. CCAP 1310/34]